MSGRVWVVRVAGLAAVTLRGRLPEPDQVLAALRTVHPAFLLLAVMAQVTSLRHFALQQRRMLAGYGVGMSLPRALAVTVSRSAITASVPAGSAISASYAFRQFRTAGASRRAAGSVTVLSGLLSGVALALLYGVVLLLPSAGTAGNFSTVAFVLATLALGFIVFAVDWRMSRKVYVPVEVTEAPSTVDAGRLARLRTAALGLAVSLRELPPRTWILSLVHAAVNWATDLACLAAVAAAFDVQVSLTRLATVYLTVQLVRQVPLSPGGIGVIEVALVAGLVSVGAPQAAAAAVVLTYRLLSCWLIIPIGGLAYAILRRDHAAPAKPSPTMPSPANPGLAEPSLTEPTAARHTTATHTAARHTAARHTAAIHTTAGPTAGPAGLPVPAIPAVSALARS
jgi:putative heme transporter